MQDGKHVILYIDDDKDFLDSVRLILESNGYIMAEAQSAEQGIKVYKESNPDFIIVDLMMEEVDAGTSLVRQLQVFGNKAPIYMLSSVGQSLSTSTDYGELGLSGVLQKPIEPATLLKILKTKLG